MGECDAGALDGRSRPRTRLHPRATAARPTALRLLRLARIMKRLQTSLNIKHIDLHIARFFSLILLVAHWIGCFWWLIDSIESAREMELGGEKT